MTTSAILSPCRNYRFRFDHVIDGEAGGTFAFFGVNPSYGDDKASDQSLRKMIGFARRNCAGKIIVGNPFAYRAMDVRALSRSVDPVGEDNARHLSEIIAAADVLIPCWGSRGKLPRDLRPALDDLRDMLFQARKPVRVFGLTASRDPVHPLMLAYSTPLVEWVRPAW